MSEKIWTDRYKTSQTGWDVGYPTPPIAAYFDQLEDKDVKILIPGAGNCYEGRHLWTTGYKRTHICDISEIPIKTFSETNPDFPSEQLIHGDFFSLEGKYDVIMEQTFFCAIDPSLRADYIRKCHDLLEDGGYIVGLMFGVEFEKSGPPHGGLKQEYRKLFSEKFKIKTMEMATNSIPSRAGNELFVKLIKR